LTLLNSEAKEKSNSLDQDNFNTIIIDKRTSKTNHRSFLKNHVGYATSGDSHYIVIEHFVSTNFDIDTVIIYLDYPLGAIAEPKVSK